MTRDDDIRSYVERPWQEIAKRKSRYWAERKLSPEKALRIADELRQSARNLRPDWPDDDERDDDIEAHRRLAAAFLRIAS